MSRNSNQRKSKTPQLKKHIVAQEDLDNNPDLVTQGINVGDEIEIPAESDLPEGKMIGNLDKDAEYPFDERWKDAVVVRQSNVKDVGDGGVKDYIEVPSSIRLAPYEPAMFARLEKDKSFGSDKVKIIHDPR